MEYGPPVSISSPCTYTEKALQSSSHSAAVLFLEVGGKLLEQGQHLEAMEMFDSSFRAINSPPCEFVSEVYRANHQVAHNTNTFTSPFVDTFHEDERDVGPRPFSKALICGEDTPLDVLQLVICYNKALVHHSRSDCAMALQIYNVIIETITATTQNHDPSIEKLHIAMRVYNNLGHISYTEQADEAALVQFETAFILARRIQDSSNEHMLDYATVLSNWCRLQWMMGSVRNDFYSALAEVLEVRSKVLSWDHADVASAHYNLGMAEFSRHNNDKATQHLTQYLTVSSHQLKQGKTHVLDPIPALVFVLLMKNENKEDKTSQDLVWGLRALQEKIQAFGPIDAEVASVLNFIGTLLFHQRELDHALLFFKEELKLEEALIEQGEDVSVSVTCNNIGRILQELGRFHHATHYYRRSLRQAFGDVSTELDAKGMAAVSPSIFDGFSAVSDLPEATMNLYSTVWYNLGLIHDKMGAYPDAILAFQMSLKLRRAMLGRNHADVACLLYNIGVLQMEQHMLNEATDSFREALRIRRVAATGQLNDRHVVKTLRKLSSLHKSKGNIAGALEACREVIDILKISVDFNLASRNRNMGSTLRDIADLHHAQGDLNLALDTAIQGVSLLRIGRSMETEMENNSVLERLNNVEQETAVLLLIGSLQHELCNSSVAHATFAEAAVLIRNSIMSEGGCDAGTFCSSLLPLFEVTSKLAYAHCAPEA